MATPRRPDRLRTILKRKADAFFGLEGAVMAGADPMAIHDMRVASRRLEELLRLVLPESKASAGVMGAIRRARRVQSRVRDLDVMAIRLREMSSGAGRDSRAAIRWMTGNLGALRRRRHRRLAERLRDLDLAGLRAALEALFPTDGRTRAARKAGVRRPDLPRRLRSQVAEREKGFTEAVAQARASATPEGYHRARVAWKRLRYTLEIAQELGAASVKRRIARLREVQQTLGHWHDLVVLEETLAGLLADEENFRMRLPVVKAACDLMEGWRSEREAYLQAFLKLTRSFPGYGAKGLNLPQDPKGKGRKAAGTPPRPASRGKGSASGSAPPRSDHPG